MISICKQIVEKKKLCCENASLEIIFMWKTMLREINYFN